LANETIAGRTQNMVSSFPLVPSQDQLTTIYICIGYSFAILILWNVRYLKELLLPFKIVTVALHEFGHASVGICTGTPIHSFLFIKGAKIESIEVNPDEGGLTKLRGGNPYLTLPAGYLSSSFYGALMLFAGFNILASKIVTVLLGVSLLVVLFYAKNWLTRFITVAFGVALGLLWWLQEVGLRYVVLFMGVMSSLYSVWDIVEDLIRRRVNESDASRFSQLCGGSPQLWGFLWFLISLSFIALSIFGALVLLPDANNQTVDIPKF